MPSGGPFQVIHRVWGSSGERMLKTGWLRGLGSWFASVDRLKSLHRKGDYGCGCRTWEWCLTWPGVPHALPRGDWAGREGRTPPKGVGNRREGLGWWRWWWWGALSVVQPAPHLSDLTWCWTWVVSCPHLASSIYHTHEHHLPLWIPPSLNPFLLPSILSTSIRSTFR